MDQENEKFQELYRSLYGKDPVSQAPAPAEKEAPVNYQDISQYLGDRQYKMPASQELGQAAKSGALQGVTQIAGLPGDIRTGMSNLLTSGAQPIEREGKFYVPSMAGPRGGREPLREISREQAEAMRSGSTWLQKATELAGKISPIGTAPTTEQIQTGLKEYSPEAKEVLEFKPERGPARFVQAGLREAPTIALPFGGGLLARTAGALGSAGAGQSVREMTRGTKYEDDPRTELAAGAASLAGGITGSLLSSMAKPVTETVKLAASKSAAEREALSRMGKTIQSDIASENAIISQNIERALREAADTGISPQGATVGQLAGKTTSQMIKNAARNEDVINEYNKMIQSGISSASDDMAAFIASKVGMPKVNMTSQVNSIEALKDAVNDPNYLRVMNLPSAQSVPNSAFLSLYTNPVFLRNIEKANEIAFTLKDKYGLVLPTDTSPGNLRYWDFMKRHFDNLGSQPAEIGTIKDAYREIAKNIRTRADKVVPEYAAARDAAAEIFGYRDALRMGREYIDMSAKRWDKLSKIEREAFNNMSPAEAYRFRVGAAAGLSEALTAPGQSFDQMRKFYNSVSSPGMQRRLRNTFGPDVADEILGRAAINSMKARASQLSATAPSFKSKFSPNVGTVAGGIAGGATTAANYIADQLSHFMVQGVYSSIDMKSLIPLALGAGFGRGVGAVITKAEQNIADQIMKLAMDPDGAVKLGKYMASNPQAPRVLAGINNFFDKNMATRAAGAALRSQAAQPEEQRFARASGGRINPSSKADGLVVAAEKAKKNINKTTEPLLNETDNNVAHALEIAGKHL
jgi:hypothetical protein